MWSWRTADFGEDAVAGWWTRGRRQWKQLRFGWRLIGWLMLASVAFFAGSLALGFSSAGLALNNIGGVPEATRFIDSENSWFPPGTRYTVVIDGGPQEVLQPWHSAGSEALMTGLVVGLVAAWMVAVLMTAALAALRPLPRR